MSLNACAEMVRAGDPNRFASAMTAPPEKRGNLFALYAFNLEVARAPWVTSEPMLAQMRIQWWVDAVREIYEGKPPRKHEVVMPLADVILSNSLDQAGFERMFEARMEDISPDPVANLERYLTDTSSALMELAAQSLGAAPHPAIADMGFASGAANLLVALPELAARGYAALPQMTPKDRVEAGEARLTQNNERGIKELAQSGLDRLMKARIARRAVDPAANPALLSAWKAESILKHAQARPQDVLTGNLNTSEFRSKAALILRATTGRW